MSGLVNVTTVFPGPNEVVLREEEIPEQVEAHQVRVRCTYSLISPGTELALLTRTHIGFSQPETHAWVRYPFYPGYAAVGQVDVVGANVEGLVPGDWVFYPGRHQAMALLDPAETPVLPVPADVPPEWVPFARLAQIANTAFHVARPAHAETVVVMGLGLVGNLAAQICRQHGASVLGIDLLSFRRGLANRCGIERTIAAEEADAIAAVHQMTGGRGADVVIEATGVPALVTPALRMARRQGRVVLLGSSRGTTEIDVYTHVHRPGVCLMGAHETVLPLRSETELDRIAVTVQMLDWLAQGKLMIEPLITHTVQPTGLPEAYRALHDQKDLSMGVLVDWRDLD